MSDKIWIIKEGLEILGPFNQAEIIAQINNKEILETDQIASPFSRFEFLKDCEEFNLLFKITDYTEISKIEHTAATEKVDQVDPSVTGFFDVTLQKQKGASRHPYKKLPSSTITDKKTIDQPKPIDNNKKTADKKSKSIDPLETPTSIKRSSSIYKTFFLSIGLISIIICLFYYQQQFVMQQKAQKEEINEKLFNQSIMDKEVGNYEKSLTSLRSILNSKPDHLQAFFHLIEILILQEKYEEARNLLNDRLLNIAPNMQYHIHHYLALIDLQKKELSRAMQNLNNTLKQKPSFVPAIINLGTLYFLNEEYEKATEQYNSTIIASSKDYLEFEGILILHQAANSIKSYLSLENREEEDLEDNIESLEEDIKNYTMEDQQYENLEDMIIRLEEYQERTYDFKLEASMMLALLELLLDNIERSRNLLSDILELDWDLTSQHSHNVLYYYLDELLWSNIIVSTFEIKNFEWNDDPNLLAIYGFLNFKTGKKEQGKEYIRRAIDLDQDNYKVKTLFAYIQDKLDFRENACEILASMIQYESDNHLCALLRQRLCTSDSSIEEQKKVLTNLQLSNYFQLQALTGLAHFSEIEQNRIAAKKYFQEAQSLSKNYKPLLELQAKWIKRINRSHFKNATRDKSFRQQTCCK